MQVIYEIFSSLGKSDISLIISITSFLFCTIGFFIYDKRIKKQEIELNDLKLSKFKEELLLKKKANFEINVVSPKSSNEVGRIIIKNTGQSTAKNVNIKTFDVELAEKILDSYTIAPNEEVSLMYIIYISSRRRCKIEIFFDDDLTNKNHIERYIELY